MLFTLLLSKQFHSIDQPAQITRNINPENVKSNYYWEIWRKYMPMTGKSLLGTVSLPLIGVVSMYIIY